MANTLTADFPEIWAKEQQRIFYKENVAMKVADVSFRGQMKAWDTLNRPYRSSNAVQSYTPWTAITIDDKTATQEQLSVNRKFATWFYIDDFEQIQSNYDEISKYAWDDAVYLSNQVDSDVLWEVANATSTVDDWTIGWTSWNWIALTTSNVLKVISAAKKKLAKQNIPLSDLFWVISPEFEDILIQYGAGRDTSMGDAANSNGFIMNFYGFALHRSNQTTGSAVLSMATLPTDTDSLTIAWVTFTFVDTIGTAAWNVHIEANVDDTVTNLTELINAPTTTDAGQVALATNNARIFWNQAAAVQTAWSDIMTVTFKWAGNLAVTNSLTDWTDTWTATSQKQHQMFWRKWAVTLVMQSDARVRLRDVETKLGKNILNGVLYWIKTFADGADQMVDVQIKSSSF